MAFSKEFLACGTLHTLDKNRLLIGFGERSWHDKLHLESGPCWYYPDFFLKSQKPYFTHEQWKIVSAQEFRAEPCDQTRLKWKSPFETLFKESFDKLKNLITKGLLSKAVPYLFETADFEMTFARKEAMIAALLAYTKECSLSIYGFWNQQEGILGATPEILFTYEKGWLYSMACAATLPSNSSAQLESKLFKEHDFVAKELKEKLSHLGPLETSKPIWEKFQTLKHLITRFSCKLERFDFGEAVKLLHPTSAVGAYPNSEGSSWLADYEKLLPRGRYGAPVGLAFQDKRSCLVGIRNVQWDQSQMRIGAGCGVVKESLFDEEKQEISAKISAIKGSLNL